MQFNSYIFILAFIPLLVVGYYILNKVSNIGGKYFLILASGVFYVYAGWKMALILGISIIVNYLFAIVIKHNKKKRYLAGGILVNIAMLFYFKYFDFFVSNLNALLKKEYTISTLIVPLGISFITFQQIMYLVNIYKDELENTNLMDYLFYILYFPKIMMGPLIEPKQLIEQFNDEMRKKVDWDTIASGIKLFSYGLFKKLILADTFANGVVWGYTNIEVTSSMDWWLIMLCYTFQIYFDFSGYSDMAVGVSNMLNIELPINFNSLYKAFSIRDFWKRWHMSLTSFLQNTYTYHLVEVKREPLIVIKIQ